MHKAVQMLLPKGKRQERDRQVFVISDAAFRLLMEIQELLAMRGTSTQAARSTERVTIPWIEPNGHSKADDLAREPYLFQWAAGESNCLESQVASGVGCQGVRSRRTALRMISSLRIQAVRASFLVLPAATRRVYKARRTGLQRLPTRARHIQGRTHGSPPTPDSPFAAHGATVAIEWRQSDQRGDLLTAKGAEFGQISQQGDTDHWTNTRHTPEQRFLFSPQRAGAYGSG